MHIKQRMAIVVLTILGACSSALGQCSVVNGAVPSETIILAGNAATPDTLQLGSNGFGLVAGSSAPIYGFGAGDLTTVTNVSSLSIAGQFVQLFGDTTSVVGGEMLELYYGGVPYFYFWLVTNTNGVYTLDAYKYAPVYNRGKGRQYVLTQLYNGSTGLPEYFEITYVQSTQDVDFNVSYDGITYQTALQVVADAFGYSSASLAFVTMTDDDTRGIGALAQLSVVNTKINGALVNKPTYTTQSTQALPAPVGSSPVYGFATSLIRAGQGLLGIGVNPVGTQADLVNPIGGPCGTNYQAPGPTFVNQMEFSKDGSIVDTQSVSQLEDGCVGGLNCTFSFPMPLNYPQEYVETVLSGHTYAMVLELSITLTPNTYYLTDVVVNWPPLP